MDWRAAVKDKEAMEWTGILLGGGGGARGGGGRGGAGAGAPLRPAPRGAGREDEALAVWVLTMANREGLH